MGGDKIALVTGAGQGIGHATALALSQAGFLTYATSRRTAPMADLEKQGCRVLELDVTEEAQRDAVVQEIVGRHGAVDILVNNAGYGLNGAVETLDMAHIRHEFETNVFGLVRMSQLILPAMRVQGNGRIINVGSVGGTFTAPGSGAYHASKYAVEAFTDALRYEVRGFGVAVVLIQPTGVRTAFDKKILTTYPALEPTSPYAAFQANHIRTTQQIFASRFSGVIEPETVARTILRAVTARRPRTRYKVGASAHIYAGLRRVASDRLWDRLMATQFPMS